jgi:serine/threonine protein kinase
VCLLISPSFMTNLLCFLARVILYVLLAGFLPFDEPTIMQLFTKIQKAEFTYPSWFTPEIRGVLDQMLVADPKVRIGLAQLREHPWFQHGAPATAPAASGSASGASTSSSDHTSAGWDDVDDVEVDDWHGASGETPPGPRLLNAFDLISQCGGFCIDRVFNPQLPQVPPMDSAPAGGSAVPVTATTMARFGSSGLRSGVHNFTSNMAGAELVAVVYNAMAAAGCEMHSSLETAASNGVIRASKSTAKGTIGIGARVFTLNAVTAATAAAGTTQSLLELRRGKGDVLEWKTLFNDLVSNRIQAHLSPPST